MLTHMHSRVLALKHTLHKLTHSLSLSLSLSLTHTHTRNRTREHFHTYSHHYVDNKTGTTIEGIKRLNYDIASVEGAERAMADLKQICIFPDTCTE